MIYQYFNGPIMKLTQEILLLDGPKKGGADNPNPTSDGKANVFLKEGGFKDISIGIYNSIGECVQFSSAPISGEFLIDLSSKSTGLYLIKIFEPKSTQVLKLIYEDGK